MSDTTLWTYHQNENRASLLEGYYRQNILIKEVSKKIPSQGKILEIGFGDGYLLAELSKKGYIVTGQDLSEENISITKKQWPDAKIEFKLGDESGKLLVPDLSLDGFVASEVCEHMTDEELKILTDELHRTLKPNAYIILTFPYHEDLSKMTQFCPHCSESFHTWGHKQSWNTEKIEAVFGNLGEVKVSRFISLGYNHAKNRYIKMLAGLLNVIFSIKQDSFEFINSNYLVVIKNTSK